MTSEDALSVVGAAWEGPLGAGPAEIVVVLVFFMLMAWAEGPAVASLLLCQCRRVGHSWKKNRKYDALITISLAQKGSHLEKPFQTYFLTRNV